MRIDLILSIFMTGKAGRNLAQSSEPQRFGGLNFFPRSMESGASYTSCRGVHCDADTATEFNVEESP
jgi:hypothetical protein